MTTTIAFHRFKMPYRLLCLNTCPQLGMLGRERSLGSPGLNWKKGVGRGRSWRFICLWFWSVFSASWLATVWGLPHTLTGMLPLPRWAKTPSGNHEREETSPPSSGSCLTRTQGGEENEGTRHPSVLAVCVHEHVTVNTARGPSACVGSEVGATNPFQHSIASLAPAALTAAKLAHPHCHGCVFSFSWCPSRNIMSKREQTLILNLRLCPFLAAQPGGVISPPCDLFVPQQ